MGVIYLQPEDVAITATPLLVLARTADPAVDGTQTVDPSAVLRIYVGSVVELDPSVFDREGTYTLFKFTTLDLNGPLTQAQLNENLTVDLTDLQPYGISAVDPHGTLDLANNRITITLTTA